MPSSELELNCLTGIIIGMELPLSKLEWNCLYQNWKNRFDYSSVVNGTQCFSCTYGFIIVLNFMSIIYLKVWVRNVNQHFFFRIFSHFYVGSVFLMRHLHFIRFCASSPESSLSDKSLLMLCNHLHSELPLLLLPGITPCPHIILLFSVHAHTTSTYFPALSWKC